MKNSDDFTVLSSFSQGYKSTQKGGVDQRGNDASGRDETHILLGVGRRKMVGVAIQAKRCLLPDLRIDGQCKG